jgi:hypothetical protein
MFQSGGVSSLRLHTHGLREHGRQYQVVTYKMRNEHLALEK